MRNYFSYSFNLIFYFGSLSTQEDNKTVAAFCFYWGLFLILTKHLTVCMVSFFDHFTATHRQTSNFYIFVDFIYICHFCFIQKIIYHLKRNRPRFSLPKFCRNSICVIIIEKLVKGLFKIFSTFLSKLQLSSANFYQGRRKLFSGGRGEG